MSHLDDIRTLTLEGKTPEEVAEELSLDPEGVRGLIEIFRLDRPLPDSDFHNK